MILVIDDDLPVCTMVRTVLERDGFPVRTATTVSEAIGIAKEKPKLILLDTHVPGIERLKTDIPILVICGERPGAAGFLKKPFTAAQLLAAVRRIIPP